jgi:type 2 lantibiotic biosynthesis protein LanM
MKMESSQFLSSDWYNAMTLAERFDALRQNLSAVQEECDPDIAQRRVRRWRDQLPFSRGSHFEQRLALEGLTERQFLAIVGTPVEVVRNRLSDRPLWLDNLARVFEEIGETVMLHDGERTGHRLEGVDPVEPLIRDSRKRLLSGVRLLREKYPFAPFEESDVENLLHGGLSERLAAMMVRTLTLELHVARLTDHLEGNSPEERFQSFLNQLREPERVLDLLREYPVLARQLSVAVDRWLSFNLELLERLCADWLDIRQSIAASDDPGRLIAWNDAGDDHRGGHHVVILEFSSGFQVVYKPRSLSMDSHFQDFLGWLNSRGQEPALRMLRILNRDGYGWVEFVSPRSCQSTAEVHRFYERQGSYLAVLYLLHATDVHNENLIAAGDDPVLIDLETLFHHSPADRRPDAVRSALMMMHASVIGVGLLPGRVWANDESDGVDLSGLGTTEGQVSPHPVQLLEYVGTDEMRWIRTQVTLSGGHNRPTVNGGHVDLLDYTEAIEAGFSRTYRLLLQHRAELLSSDGPLARFAGDELRIILRSTQTYAALLRESFHPDFLRDALERDRLFDRLWIPIERQPYLRAVISAERRDLWNGDIPVFSTRTDSCDLWTSNHDRLADFFHESAMAAVVRRLSQFGADDLDRQMWFIRASLATLQTRVAGDGASIARSGDPISFAGRASLLSAAQAIGDKLGALAVRSEDEAIWIGLTLGPRRRWRVSPVSVDLYDGLPGIVLFLAYLGCVTRDDTYKALARAGLTAMRRQAEGYRAVLKTIGGFSGWGGVVYALSSLATLWNDSALRDEATEIVDVIAPLIQHDNHLDLMSGAAGSLASIISLYHAAPSARTLATAAKCGDHLIARAQAMSTGIAWPTPREPRALTGFSHGAAGIGWALLNLADLTGEQKYREAAEAAIRYERSLFSPENGNWPDLRAPEAAVGDAQSESTPFMTAWCHGAPGIGLARLLSLGRLDDPDLHSEITIALQTTLRDGPAQDHSLCHGELGNVDFLLQASEVLDDADLHRQTYQRAGAVVMDIERHGWRCGLPAGVESPGLMTGLAGIGYQLLRLAEPKRVPSVLVLAPPMTASR